MKSILRRMQAPSRKDLRLFISLLFTCSAVLWLISETRTQYFYSGFLTLNTITASLWIWRQYQKTNPRNN
ncbi:MAG: hypothetical protein NTW29_04130 [Bacteroidetes bacterium]|nr:hypothetical protein [Bacteroidota bacterium]